MAISDAKKRANAKYNKEHMTQRKLGLTLEDDERLGRYLDHIGQGFSEFVRKLVIDDMNKNGWKELIKPPKNYGKKSGNV